MYNIHYDVCAILLLIVEIVLYYSRRNHRVMQNKIYVCMIYALFISTACDLTSGIVANSEGAYPREVSIIANNLYFISHPALPMLFVLYNIAMMIKNKKQKKWQKLIFYLPYAAVLVLLVINAFTGILFSVDKNGQYVRGVAISTAYIVAIFYFTVAIIYITKNRRYIEPYRIFLHTYLLCLYQYQ